MLEDRVALSVANQVTLGFANRQGRRRPDGAGVFIAKVNDFSGRIAYGIVRPGRQTILMAISRPGEAATVLRNQETKVRAVRDHIGPWRRRPLAFALNNHILASAMGKAAESVKE